MSGPSRERALSLRDGLFSIEVPEAGAGQPTLYLHGELPAPGWHPWQDDLATDRRLIAPRHPGFGRSTGLEHLDDVLDLAIFYLDFLDARHLDQVDLIGDSFGGMLAAEVAALAPQRVRRLVLVAPLGLWLDEAPVADVFAMSHPEIDRVLWADPDGPVAASFAVDRGTDEEVRAAWVERMRSLAAAGKFLWPIPDKGLRKRIHRIAVPTLLLWGAADRVAPPVYGKLFQQKISSAELVEVPGAGHLPLLEKRAEAVEVVRRFLGS